MFLNCVFGLAIVWWGLGPTECDANLPSSSVAATLGDQNELLVRNMFLNLMDEYKPKTTGNNGGNVKMLNGKKSSKPLVDNQNQINHNNTATTLVLNPNNTTNATGANQQEKKSGLKPMSMRTIRLRDNLLKKAQAPKKEEVKKLSFAPVSYPSSSSSQQYYGVDPSIAFNMGVMSMNSVAGGSIPSYHQSNQYMMPNQVQQFGSVAMPHHQVHHPHHQAAYQTAAGGAGNYFQSNTFSDNPLRKNSDLNKERMRLLQDTEFLRDNPKLSHFLFTKYLKGVASIPDDNKKEESKSKSVKKIDKVKEKQREKSEKSEKNEKSRKKSESNAKNIDDEDLELFDEDLIDMNELKEKEVRVKEKSSSATKPKDEKSTKASSNQESTSTKSSSSSSSSSTKEKKESKGTKDNKSKNVLVLDLDDLENYLSNVKKDITFNQAMRPVN